MKKSFVIIIVLTYLASIVFIGFFGMELSSYNQTFYVNQITITNSNYNAVTNRITLTYQPYNSDTDLFNPNVFQLEWRVYPENASNRTVSFTSDSAKATVSNIGTVIFNSPGTAKISIRSTDGADIKKDVIIWFQ
jgi:hypothetical protein